MWNKTNAKWNARSCVQLEFLLCLWLLPCRKYLMHWLSLLDHTGGHCTSCSFFACLWSCLQLGQKQAEKDLVHATSPGILARSITYIVIKRCLQMVEIMQYFVVLIECVLHYEYKPMDFLFVSNANVCQMPHNKLFIDLPCMLGLHWEISDLGLFTQTSEQKVRYFSVMHGSIPRVIPPGLLPGIWFFCFS